jgi:hypothetical protein
MIGIALLGFKNVWLVYNVIVAMRFKRPVFETMHDFGARI